MKKYLVIAVVIIVGFSMVTCQAPETGIRGTLILQTGQSGDVRNCRVQLFQTADLTGTPLKEVASDASGTDPTRSSFEITDVIPGYYYLVAWKDLNGNGKIDHLDIVGVYGGKYKPGYGGSQLTVQEGKITDVGEIVMYIYKELQVTLVSATRLNDNGLETKYKFNDNCYLNKLTLTMPSGLSGTNSKTVGEKTKDTEYSAIWYYDADGDGYYDPFPSGTYTLTFDVTYEGEIMTFTVTFTL